MSETNATYTENLGLIKPDQDDDYNVDDFNDNADIIDREITATKTKNTEQDTAISDLQDAISGQGEDISDLITAITNLQNSKMEKDFSNATVALPVVKGGTGATTAEQARQNLGLGSNATPTLGSIELVAATPFIDMRFNNTQDDHNVRIINDSDKQLTICGFNGQKIDVRIVGQLFVDGNRYKHVYIQSSFPAGAPEGSILIHQ